MLADLHTHTNASDGSLAPSELIAAAIAAGVDMLAITDHDTVSSLEPILPTLGKLKLIPGIELSTTWQGIGVHILGLNINHASSSMIEAVAEQSNARQQRAELIAERLTRAGCAHSLAGARAIAGHDNVGRVHFARFLAQSGFVKDESQAFKKFLGAGKIGDVKQHWASLAQVVDWIRGAGGIAVLAHPGKYRLTATKRGRLIDAFQACGGQALEVISGRQDPSLTKILAASASDRGLWASCGSDFHHTKQPWAALGMPLSLPRSCEPVWHHF